MDILYAHARAYTIIYIHLCIHIVTTSRENNAIYKCIMGKNYQQQCVQQCHCCMNVSRVAKDLELLRKTGELLERVALEETPTLESGASAPGCNGLHRSVYRVPIFFRHLNHRSQSFGVLDAISMAGLGQKITLDLDAGHWTYKVDHNYTPNHGEFLH